MGYMKANEGKTVHLRPLGGTRVLRFGISIRIYIYTLTGCLRSSVSTASPLSLFL